MATNPGSEAFVRDLLSGSYVERDILKEVSGATKEYWEANLRAAMRQAGGTITWACPACGHKNEYWRDRCRCGLALPPPSPVSWPTGVEEDV